VDAAKSILYCKKEQKKYKMKLYNNSYCRQLYLVFLLFAIYHGGRIFSSQFPLKWDWLIIMLKVLRWVHPWLNAVKIRWIILFWWAEGFVSFLQCTHRRAWIHYLQDLWELRGWRLRNNHWLRQRHLSNVSSKRAINMKGIRQGIE
jgi:hypothetical protein